LIPYGYRSVACAIIREVTGRKRLERELEHRAFHDELTGLPNRALFTEHPAEALARSDRRGSLAVLFLDLDNFKFVNDSLSHEVGNRLLVEVAGRLRSCLRRTDSAARLGGDEFTVLVEDVDGAERIFRTLREPFVLDGRELLATFSIGIALSESEADTPEEVLRNADTAMYRAKKGGRARYEIFEASMNERALERLELETDLRRAVERDEIRVYYQPKVVGRTGEIHGIEALTRWLHPHRGLVSPASFIHVAEETGLISAIGQRVLE
jgi:diguanylate cyclase (GGDEF)-like protein